MKTKKSQEFQKLLNSVRAQFNLSNELDSRREEAEQGLSQHEQAFVEEFPAGSCLLDIGCASGRLCFALAQHGYTATGIDKVRFAEACIRLRRQNECVFEFLVPSRKECDGFWVLTFG